MVGNPSYILLNDSSVLDLQPGRPAVKPKKDAGICPWWLPAQGHSGGRLWGLE